MAAVRLLEYVVKPVRDLRVRHLAPELELSYLSSAKLRQVELRHLRVADAPRPARGRSKEHSRLPGGSDRPEGVLVSRLIQIPSLRQGDGRTRANFARRARDPEL